MTPTECLKISASFFSLSEKSEETRACWNKKVNSILVSRMYDGMDSSTFEILLDSLMIIL